MKAGWLESKMNKAVIGYQLLGKAQQHQQHYFIIEYWTCIAWHKILPIPSEDTLDNLTKGQAYSSKM